jgi:hypothetical protein
MLSAPIGNGIVGTIVDSTDVYLGGVYNTFVELPNAPRWRVNSSARAMFPSTTSAVSLVANASLYALDVRRSVFIARWGPVDGLACLQAERRTYAPRLDAPLLVTELEFHSTCNLAVNIPIRNTFDPNGIAQLPDLDVKMAPCPHGTHCAAFAGSTRVAEPTCMGLDAASATQTCVLGSDHDRPLVAVVYDTVPDYLSVAPGVSNFTFVSAYGSSLNSTGTPLEQAGTIYTRARELAEAGQLFSAHTSTMASLWDASAGGASILVHDSGAPDADASRLARGIWTSLHALVASMSAVWGAGFEVPAAHAFSPGGIFSGGVREKNYPWVGYLGYVARSQAHTKLHACPLPHFFVLGRCIGDGWREYADVAATCSGTKSSSCSLQSLRSSLLLPQQVRGHLLEVLSNGIPPAGHCRSLHLHAAS